LSDFRLKSSQFRSERELAWLELEVLIKKCQEHGLRSLSADEVLELTKLYQHAVGSLSTARAISLDRSLLDYLESLVSRAHLAVYGLRRRPVEVIGDFLVRTFPGTVRRFRWHLAAAILCLAASVAAGSLIVARDHDHYYALVASSRSAGRTPTATTDELRRPLYDSGPGKALALEHFATALFTHNARVGLLCAALGVAAGLPIAPLLAATGLELGAMAELYRSRGLGLEFWAWILPHGVTELLAVALCAAAGLAFGTALAFPGARTRRESMASQGREAALLVLGAMGMFLIAAAIEGVFRQTVQSPGIRWGVSVSTALFWILYFGLAGRRRGTRLG
jgi:uncharacterized membrane protein SpoIIM required for sporulation